MQIPQPSSPEILIQDPENLREVPGSASDSLGRGQQARSCRPSAETVALREVRWAWEDCKSRNVSIRFKTSWITLAAVSSRLWGARVELIITIEIMAWFLPPWNLP